MINALNQFDLASVCSKCMTSTQPNNGRISLTCNIPQDNSLIHESGYI